MSKCNLIAIALLLLSSCGYPPSNEELISKYISAPEAFEELAKLIEVDALKDPYGCLTVGLDNIRNYWYEPVKGSWSRSAWGDKPFSQADMNLSLPDVLKLVGLSEQRYSIYKELFQKTGSERVTFCQTNKMASPEVNILIFRSGTTMGGWIAYINQRKDRVVPKDTNSRCCSTKNIKIRDGWYLSVFAES